MRLSEVMLIDFGVIQATTESPRNENLGGIRDCCGDGPGKTGGDSWRKCDAFCLGSVPRLGLGFTQR